MSFGTNNSNRGLSLVATGLSVAVSTALGILALEPQLLAINLARRTVQLVISDAATHW